MKTRERQGGFPRPCGRRVRYKDRIGNGAAFFHELHLGRGSRSGGTAAGGGVRVIDAFVNGLDARRLRFGRSVPAATGWPPYDPRDLLNPYLYGSQKRCARRAVWSWSPLTSR